MAALLRSLLRFDKLLRSRTLFRIDRNEIVRREAGQISSWLKIIWNVFDSLTTILVRGGIIKPFRRQLLFVIIYEKNCFFSLGENVQCIVQLIAFLEYKFVEF